MPYAAVTYWIENAYRVCEDPNEIRNGYQKLAIQRVPCTIKAITIISPQLRKTRGRESYRGMRSHQSVFCQDTVYRDRHAGGIIGIILRDIPEINEVKRPKVQGQQDQLLHPHGRHKILSIA